MTLLLDIVCSLFLLGGAAFCLIGGIGLIRFPDVYTRAHAAGITDSAGAGGVLFGLMFARQAEPLVVVKLMTILVFVWLSSVVSAHALLKAAFARGVRVHDDSPTDWTIPSRPPARDEPPHAEAEAEEE